MIDLSGDGRETAPRDYFVRLWRTGLFFEAVRRTVTLAVVPVIILVALRVFVQYWVRKEQLSSSPFWRVRLRFAQQNGEWKLEHGRLPRVHDSTRLLSAIW